MNPRTRQALGLLGLSYTALMAVYNTCFFSVTLTRGQWTGTGIVAALSLGLIAEASLRKNPKGKIHWAPLCGVLCGMGLGRLLRTEMQFADYILGGVLIAAGVLGLFLMRSQKITESE